MRFLFFAGLLVLTVAFEGKCQETVFALLKSDLKNADEYYNEKNFKAALSLYSNVARRNHAADGINLKIARCYYFMKHYEQAAKNYEAYIKVSERLPLKDIYYYAEALAAMKKYNSAADHYKQYLKQAPGNELVTKKIWRLNNIQFLYEDSMHYAVRPVRLNTASGELCAAPYGKGLIFMSNRKEVQVVEKIDAALHAPFYRIYYAVALPDTTINAAVNYSKPSIFSKELNSGYHAGPVAFYHNGKKMVFTSTGNQTGNNGGRTLQLFFAEEQEGSWKVTSSFPFNSVNYSISDPTVSRDGTMLYFSSDLPGGLGGKDLYRSEYKEGQWSRPVNLGEHINTPYDEVFPYVHQARTLYFSSNGHAGIGGLDIYKSEITSEGFDEVQNAGYPINTNHDEFGIVIDSLNTHGYFSSNRADGGYNDDIYEFDMDLETYPLTITGLIRYKEHNWSDSSELKAFPNAKLALIDNIRNVTVHEGLSDGSGNFSIVIPYFSKYIIKVTGVDHDEHIVSLEIPKHRREFSAHDIVIVKDAFKSNDNPVVK